MGRVLVLDGMIQITNELEDNYTVDLTKEVVKKDKDYNHILIIGGGDLIIARYLVEKFPNVKQITLCEIDAKVVEAVKKYFNIIGESIDKAIASKKLTVNIGDGAVFAKDCAEKKVEFDGIIIDNTDVYIEGGPANSLFTVEFFKSLHTILKTGGAISQQVSEEKTKAK